MSKLLKYNKYMLKFVIGIDLHGTLLDNEWEIKSDLLIPLDKALEGVRGFCKVYVCSGNDLTFIHKFIPKEIYRHFDGYVLETGCVISEGKNEDVIVPSPLIEIIRDLEYKLKKKNFPWVQYFARRKSTISLFTRTESEGEPPDAVFPEVKAIVKQLGFGEDVRVTHSNVAVDIIPRGFDKFRGLGHVASGRPTIGIADSMNDIELVRDADLAFIPANASLKLIRELAKKGKSVLDLGDTLPKDKEIVWRSRFSSTRGVLEILGFIEDVIKGY